MAFYLQILLHLNIIHRVAYRFLLCRYFILFIAFIFKIFFYSYSYNDQFPIFAVRFNLLQN